MDATFYGTQFISGWFKMAGSLLGQPWLLTTDSMAHKSAVVIMLALVQCILNLLVHNLPCLTACNNLCLYDMGTSPCAFHWNLPTMPHVQCVPSIILCSWRTCQTYQQRLRCLGSIPGSLSSTAARCLPDILRFSWPLVISADGCDILWIQDGHYKLVFGQPGLAADDWQHGSQISVGTHVVHLEFNCAQSATSNSLQ